MRIRSNRAVLVLLCTALVLGMGTWEAGASLSDLLFPASILDSNAHQDPPGSNNERLSFSTMLGMIPAGNETTGVQMGGPYSLKNSYGGNTGGQTAYRTKLSTAPTSWMDSVVAPVVSGTSTDNVAMSSYNRLIGRFPNQSNIFEPYSFDL